MAFLMSPSLFLFLFYFSFVQCRIHHLQIEEDYRSYISLTSFGFYKGGYLFVELNNFHFSSSTDALFGFTLEKVLNDAIDPYMETYRDKCLLKDSKKVMETKKNVIFFIMDLQKKELKINCSAQAEIENLRIYSDKKQLPVTSLSEQNAVINGKNDIVSENKNSRGASCINLTLPITVKSDPNTKTTMYSTKFVALVPTENEEGLYELYFHNCANYEDISPVPTYFSMLIEEFNVQNYLSAGEMPLPALYFTMSIMFFLSAQFWIYILIKSSHPVFKIHWLMGVLVMLKALALFFHGINYHYIEVRGEHVATWAILYYITHLLKGSVLFITIILIGTGWNFIKHILSPKDKKIFMIVIPLQVFANVAEIILEESEEGDAEHRRWLDVFTFVDMICCFAILFPIVWSLKHLQDASHTDGKVAINLRKLKLFRHFYVMIVCYIYFTRIVVYLLKMTVPFRYEWLDEMFKEITTFVFFVLTGYRFRPATSKVYFEEPEEDDDKDIVISQCGLTEGLTKLNRISNENADDDKDTLLVYERESSHDYD